MTTQSSNISQAPNYTLCNPYTGTSDNPDTVSIFFKSGRDIEIRDEDFFNSTSHSPANYIHNIPIVLWKISEATKRIFANTNGDGDDLWNACKNLGRGIVQLFPLVGNVALYLYDLVKIKFYTHPQIKTALANENGPMLGFAFDGKVISTFSRSELESFFQDGSSAQSDKPLDLLYCFWLMTLEDKLKKGTDRTRLQLATSLANLIHQRV